MADPATVAQSAHLRRRRRTKPHALGRRSALGRHETRGHGAHTHACLHTSMMMHTLYSPTDQGTCACLFRWGTAPSRVSGIMDRFPTAHTPRTQLRAMAAAATARQAAAAARARALAALHEFFAGAGDGDARGYVRLLLSELAATLRAEPERQGA